MLLDGGKIVAVGKEVNAPADAQVIDATGCLVTPGLIDGHCHIGMEEAAIGFEGTDGNECTDPLHPKCGPSTPFSPWMRRWPKRRRQA